MRQEYELIHHTKIKHLNAFVINIGYRNFHTHSDFELLLILEGNGKIRIKNDTYEVNSGDAILVNPHEIHKIDAKSGDMKLIILQFSRHFLNEYFPILRNTHFSAPFVKSCFFPKDYVLFLQAVLNLSISYITGQDFFALDCIRLSTEILKSFYTNLPYELLTENAYQERKKRSDRMNRISAYIDENFLYPIRLQNLAEQEGISTTHLSHFFTDNFGITFQEYLNDIRLEQALQLAGNSKYSLAALSELSGFSDPKYLNKAFLHKFGYPFSEYKKHMRETVDKPNENSQALQHYYSEEESLNILDAFIKKFRL